MRHSRWVPAGAAVVRGPSFHDGTLTPVGGVIVVVVIVVAVGIVVAVAVALVAFPLVRTGDVGRVREVLVVVGEVELEKSRRVVGQGLGRDEGRVADDVHGLGLGRGAMMMMMMMMMIDGS